MWEALGDERTVEPAVSRDTTRKTVGNGRYLRRAALRIMPKMIVPTNRMRPMTASQMSPLIAKPTTESTAQITSRMINTVHMFATVQRHGTERNRPVDVTIGLSRTSPGSFGPHRLKMAEEGAHCRQLDSEVGAGEQLEIVA